MKTGRNLQEVLVELDRQNKAKQDFIAPAQGMRLREDGHTFELNHLTIDRQMTFGTTVLFHRQVASALGIPAKYYDLMQSQKPELLAENVNAWFADRTSSYMVRSMDYGSGQVARALLSERYRRIDNMEIATSVLPLFAGNDQYEVMSCEVTENRLYLKVVNHRLEMEVRKDDIVQAGVMISNSEVGLGAVSIQPLVYRLVCTNGMVVNDMGERRHHVGRQAKAVEDSFTLYSDETMEAEDKAFLLKLRDTTMAAIDEARFAQVVGRLQESMASPLPARCRMWCSSLLKATASTQMSRRASSNTSSKAVTCRSMACPMRSPERHRTLPRMTVPPHWRESAGKSPPWSRLSGKKSTSEVSSVEKETLAVRWVEHKEESLPERRHNRGHADPTADAAIGHVLLEERRKNKKKRPRTGVWRAEEVEQSEGK